MPLDAAGVTEPSPELFFDTLSAYQKSEALKAALELDIFTAIGEGKRTAKDLAASCQAALRGVEILADYLTVMGFLTKEGSRYALTPSSEVFLNRHSLAYMGEARTFMLSSMMRENFGRLTESVRNGGALPAHSSVAPENPCWVEFARSMSGMMAMPAQMIARKLGVASLGKMNVLDIAAGHGIFGITMAQHNPQAVITAIDWPGVLEVARENAVSAGVSERYITIAGDAFAVDFHGVWKDYFDVVLLPNFLHHFDRETCVAFLKKMHAVLRPEGLVAMLEFIPNEDRISPSTSARFSLIMLATTPSGSAYTWKEYQEMYREAGFSHAEMQQLPPSPQQLVIAQV